MILEADLERLACPDCPGEPIEPEDLRLERGAVRAGALGCGRCGARFEVTDGVPWLLPAALQGARRHGIESFPEEWRRWGERLGAFGAWRGRTWGGGAEEERARHRVVAERRRDAFAAFCGKIRGRALEVGCGDGYLARARGFSAEEYWGVDPMPIEGADYAFRFAAAIGERLPFRTATFQAVLVKDSLHHFADPGAFLDAARRITAPGGALLICQGVEDAAGPAPTSARRRVLLHRAATAARLLARGEIGEIRRRAARAAAPGAEPDHYLHRVTRAGLESEIAARFAVESARMDGSCLFLRARVA